MSEKETDELKILEDPNFFQQLTAEVWKENFDTVGYICIGIGDEPEGCTSIVYKNKHRVIVALDENFNLKVRSAAPDFDWEKALYGKD